MSTKWRDDRDGAFAEILCDGVGCFDSVDHESDDEDATRRRAQEEYGYTRTPDGRDLCPACSNATARGEEEK